MKDVSRTIETDAPLSVKSARVIVPLRLKAFYAVTLALIPIAVVGFAGAYVCWSSSSLAVTVLGLLSVSLSVFGYEVHAYYFLFTTLLLLAGMFGYFAIDSFLIRPIRFINAWLMQAKATGFENIAVLPLHSTDEIGNIARLVSTVAALAAQVKKENAQLMQEQSIFLTIAAHQLRTPLTGLLWSIESLLNPDTADGERQKLMVDVDTLLKRMRLIVNHILATVKVESGKFGYVFELVDIMPMITRLMEEYKPVADSRHVAMYCKQSEGLFPVYADIERLELALFDLISNAVDYTPAEGSVTISVTAVGDRLEVAVTDTGIGITEAEIPQLFTKFHRGERARHLRPDGSGLGLFLVKEIISSHSSDITVTSKEGSGSRFSFYLSAKKEV